MKRCFDRYLCPFLIILLRNISSPTNQIGKLVSIQPPIFCSNTCPLVHRSVLWEYFFRCEVIKFYVCRVYWYQMTAIHFERSKNKAVRRVVPTLIPLYFFFFFEIAT